jgi:hypothetical protein
MNIFPVSAFLDVVSTKDKRKARMMLEDEEESRLCPSDFQDIERERA